MESQAPARHVLAGALHFQNLAQLEERKTTVVQALAGRPMLMSHVFFRGAGVGSAFAAGLETTFSLPFGCTFVAVSLLPGCAFVAASLSLPCGLLAASGTVGGSSGGADSGCGG